METGVQQQEQPHITCTTCGKKFRYKPEMAGRSVKCVCGAAIIIPRPHSAAGDDDSAYDVVEAPAPRRPAAAAAAPVAVGLAAGPGAADAPLPLGHNLPPQRRGLTQEVRKTNEELVPPSTLRDWIIPSILIPIGIGLRFFEVMSLSATKAPMEFGPALAAVALKVILSVGLMLGGMFLAVSILEVNFIGPRARIAYRLIAIAIAPGALYGICSYAGGEMYGAMIGTFLSIAVYGLLFWLLMRLDLKDTTMCVVITWILVTAANYAAYRAEGMMRDSWV
jgi:hypothetical protein